MMHKSSWRKRLLQNRSLLGKEKREELSLIITKKVIEHPLFKEANTIFIYLSTDEEVGTNLIIQEALQQKKTVAVPSCENKRRMHFYKLNSLEDCVIGKWGIRQPCKMTTLMIPNDTTLIIVPCLGIREDHYRIGYGGGYYDTYIQQYISTKTMGLSFSINKNNAIPIEAHDCRLTDYLTD